MKLKVKEFFLNTGWPYVCVLTEADSKRLGLHPLERVKIVNGKKETIAMLDVATDKRALKNGEIGLFQEVFDVIGAKKNKIVTVEPEPVPRSLHYIKKKMDGLTLNEGEIFEIIKDIAERRLSEHEMAYFVTGVYINKMNSKETYYLTKAMVNTGEKLKLNAKYVMDKHCIGGVPGNRTTMLIVPILAANGLAIPKTSSKAITSPAGTADTMEVLADVNLDMKRIKEVVKKTKGCVTWGGGVNLAPSDDMIIRVERPVSIDAKSQLLASVIAKKASVSATHLLIDIPFGHNAKIKTRKQADLLAKDFVSITKKFGIKTTVIATPGGHPIGNGIGPALEAIDVMKVLENHPEAPRGVRAKALYMAGIMLEMGGKAKKGEGMKLALKTLVSGKALKKMNDIIDAQGRKVKHWSNIKVGKYTENVIARKDGKVKAIHNVDISRLCRAAGNPLDFGAGVYLHKHMHDKVKKGEVLFTVFAEAKSEMENVRTFLKYHPDIFVLG